MSKILLLEDNESFGYILKEYLSLHDLGVVWVKNGNDALQIIRQEKFDLCILDIMLPDKSGFEVAQEISKDFQDLPFIFLSAKSLKVDKLKGFKIGADDYITKPIDEELLLAKIRAILNRSTNATLLEDNYFIGEYHFVFSTQQLIYKNEPINLTKREAELLRLLCCHQNQLLPRKKALYDIWGVVDEFSRKSMDVFISRLRKFLAKDPHIQITNVHGQGFILSVK